MKKIIAIFALASIVASATAQDITKAGLYNKNGELVVPDKHSATINVTLHLVTEKFTPGVYARYASKYLGTRAALAEYTSVKLAGGRLALGEAAKPAVVVATEAEVLPLPVNKLAATAQSAEEEAQATANMIFSLRKSRLDLITGEAGENVFGAGLKNALEEIDAMEKSCLEMFFGKKVVTEEVHTFNIAITPETNEYVVCRFNEKSGIVAADDLSGKPIVVKVEVGEYKDYSAQKQGKDKIWFTSEYTVVPQSKCLLIGETTLIDALDFVSPIYGRNVRFQATK